MLKVLLTVLVGLTVTVPAFAEPVQRDDIKDYGFAQEAYRKGDYALAFKSFRLLAEHGADAESDISQLKLGEMYEKGRGVKQDYVQSYFWYHMVASEAYGEDVGQARRVLTPDVTPDHDVIIEEAWFSRENLAKIMTSAQIEKAMKLVREWEAIHEH